MTSRAWVCIAAGSVAWQIWPPYVPGDQVLDVCCGTGDIALELARRRAQVVGLDLCRPMLDIAERRRDSGTRSGRPGPCGPDAPRFIQADALYLPFGDNSFDAVTAGYGLRNLADWQEGLRQMQRVARPGGRLVVLDFGRPGNPIWRAMVMAYLRFLVPLLGLAVCGNLRAYAYVHESLRHYPAQLGLEDTMREIGLVEVSTVNLLGGAMSITRAVKACRPPVRRLVGRLCETARGWRLTETPYRPFTGRPAWGISVGRRNAPE